MCQLEIISPIINSFVVSCHWYSHLIETRIATQFVTSNDQNIFVLRKNQNPQIEILDNEHLFNKNC